MKSSPSILYIVYGISLCLIVSCSNKKVEITNEYIINENWSKEGEKVFANSISINKMKVIRDSFIDPFIDLSQAEILSKLEEDSSFFHYANIKIRKGESYINKKIYFNQDNGFYWGCKSLYNSADTVKTIGTLQKNTWYKFSNLGTFSTQYIYVYVDSTNKLHRFNVMHTNF